jgi:hypothetical protein
MSRLEVQAEIFYISKCEVTERFPVNVFNIEVHEDAFNGF